MLFIDLTDYAVVTRHTKIFATMIYSKNNIEVKCPLLLGVSNNRGHFKVHILNNVILIRP
ncbi:hypothetical protein GCM10007425_27550 [Lysinibacillus alkalisoli]|uniref:Uncharacterized protein n=1 Tax=Lysinibacillus alkalisoli TaxID=1911548 RepID=A0A917LJF9_9BACI|nr:hypothetical protein GCM10007425_27550 [Lysinibacillus alkalisoli]